MSKFTRLGNDLYTGKKSIDFIGSAKIWYALSASVLLIAMLALFLRPLNWGIEFTGGAEYRAALSANQVNQALADKVREAVAGTKIAAAKSPVVTTSGSESIIVQTGPVDDTESTRIVEAIRQATGTKASAISQTEIGPSWGAQVAKRSLIGLGVFLVLVMLMIWAYFREWKMSVAAVAALIHDVLITIGIYALSGFEVTPATVTGFLTILGYSLYDTVVVFDKVRENTSNLAKSRMTYAAAANLAVNQTLVRSINTTLVALLPVAAILWVGVVQLGSGSLKDLALALFIGMAVGAYSSIFIAPPLLVRLKGREAQIQQSDMRARTRQKHDDPAARGDGVKVKTRTIAGDSADESVPGETWSNSGRVVPPAHGPVQHSAAAGRVQPVRKARSKRGKK